LAVFYWLIESQFKGSASSQWQYLSFCSTSLACLHDGVSRMNAYCIDCDSISGRYVEVWRYGDCYLGCSKATINNAVCYVNWEIRDKKHHYVRSDCTLQILIQLLKNNQNDIVLFRPAKKCLNLLYCKLIFFIFMQERKNTLKYGDKLRTTYLFYS
jgi:hypothetical protein